MGKHLIKWLLGITIAAVVASLLMPVIGRKPAGPSDRARIDVNRLKTALGGYLAEYGTLPPGDVPAIIRGLVYQNPRRINFLDAPQSRLSWKGELLDPWGCAYRIDILTTPQEFKVHSSGKNKIDEPNDPHSDDICSWR